MDHPHSSTPQQGVVREGVRVLHRVGQAEGGLEVAAVLVLGVVGVDALHAEGGEGVVAEAAAVVLMKKRSHVTLQL